MGAPPPPPPPPPPASDSLEQAVVPTIWVEKSTLSADSANLNDIEQSLAFYNPKHINATVCNKLVMRKLAY